MLVLFEKWQLALEISQVNKAEILKTLHKKIKNLITMKFKIFSQFIIRNQVRAMSSWDKTDVTS